MQSRKDTQGKHSEMEKDSTRDEPGFQAAVEALSLTIHYGE